MKNHRGRRQGDPTIQYDRHLRAVPHQDGPEPPAPATTPRRTIATADIVRAFRDLGLDPDTVTAISVTTSGLIVHSRARIADAIHVAERTSPDGSTIHTHCFPWTQEAHP